MAVLVECGACHKRFKAGDGLAGEKVKCPQCGSPIQIPGPERPKPAGPSLAGLLEEGQVPAAARPRPSARAAAPGARTCPSCGVGLTAEAVLCVGCGFDLRSGRRLKAPAAVSEGAGATIPFTCPFCGLRTSVGREHAGKSGPCRGCGRMITVPPLSQATRIPEKRRPPPAGYEETTHAAGEAPTVRVYTGGQREFRSLRRGVMGANTHIIVGALLSLLVFVLTAVVVVIHPERVAAGSSRASILFAAGLLLLTTGVLRRRRPLVTLHDDHLEMGVLWVTRIPYQDIAEVDEKGENKAFLAASRPIPAALAVFSTTRIPLPMAMLEPEEKGAVLKELRKHVAGARGAYGQGSESRHKPRTRRRVSGLAIAGVGANGVVGVLGLLAIPQHLALTPIFPVLTLILCGSFGLSVLGLILTAVGVRKPGAILIFWGCIAFVIAFVPLGLIGLIGATGALQQLQSDWFEKRCAELKEGPPSSEQWGNNIEREEKQSPGAGAFLAAFATVVVVGLAAASIYFLVTGNSAKQGCPMQRTVAEIQHHDDAPDARAKRASQPDGPFPPPEGSESVLQRAQQLAEQVNAVPSGQLKRQSELMEGFLGELTRIWPVEADRPFAVDSKAHRKPTTGPDSADWFGYGLAGYWRVFEVAAGKPLLLSTRGDGQVISTIRFTISERSDGDWAVKQKVDGPTRFDGHRWYFYTPETSRIRVDAQDMGSMFYLRVYQL